LNAAAGPPAVGILRVALFPVTFATVAAAPLGIALLPEQASLDARGRVDDLRRSVRGHALLGLAVGIGGAVAGWFALPWIVGVLYGGRFDAAIGPARILLVAAVATLAVGWSRTLPAAIGRPGVRARVAAFELVLTAGAVGLLASGGPVGAAAGISAAAVGAGVAWWIAAARMLDRREREMASCAAS
jgi:O-antigen/teichoic acid export membrane protein